MASDQHFFFTCFQENASVSKISSNVLRTLLGINGLIHKMEPQKECESSTMK